MYTRYVFLAATLVVFGLSAAQAQPTSSLTVEVESTASPAVEIESAAGADLFRVMDDGRLHVPAGATAGYVLTTDADGYATWQMPPAGGTGFSLPFVGSGDGSPLLKLTTTSTATLARAIWGEATANTGIGVYGRATGALGSAFGVWGEAASFNGEGVRGVATHPTGDNFGVKGLSHSTIGTGVVGRAVAETGINEGVLGITESVAGRGVYGVAVAETGTGIGVYGVANSPDGWAGLFDGRLHVSGRTGIGTAAPAANLHVEDNSTLGTPHLLLQETDPSDFARLRMQNRNASGFWDVAAGGTDLDRLNVYRSGAGDLMTIRNSGNVGIGTTEPVERLDVAGTVRAERVQYTAPRTQYTSIGGPSFQPQVIHADTRYSVAAGNGGAYYNANSLGWGMTATLHVPHGSVLRSFQPRIYDDAALDLRCVFYRQLLGGFIPLAEVASSGTPGYATLSEPLGGHVVDNREASYMVICNTIGGDWENVGDDLRMHGVTIEYTLTEAQ